MSFCKSLVRNGGISLSILLTGCSATINQSSFAPPPADEPVDVLATPPGYASQTQYFDLPGLGKIHSVRLDNPNSDTVIIYSGGNGNFVSQQSERAAALAKASGADIILYDYPSRGGTTIAPTIQASLDTGPKFLEQLKTAGWIGNGPLYSYGLSYGGRQAAALVRNGGFNGLIIEGSATDYKAIAKDFIPGLMKPLVKIKIDPALNEFEYYSYIKSSRAPVLLISSAGDKTIRPGRMMDLKDQLEKDGVSVKFVSAPGAHGGAFRETVAMGALSDFVRAD